MNFNIKFKFKNRIIFKYKKKKKKGKVSSGPFLVSRTGDAGWTERQVKVPEFTFIPDTIKGVNSFWQQDGGHGSRNPLRSV